MPNPAEGSVEVRQPKLLSYCSALYDLFLKDSTIEISDGVELTVWRGQLIKTSKAVGIPDGVYKRVMDQLQSMNCIEQVDRGYRGQWPTTVILYRPPTAETWEDERRQGTRSLTDALQPAILSRRLDDLERRLPATIDIIKALAELQQQIDNMNTRFNNQNQGEN